MIAHLAILAVEVGYVAGVAVLTKSVLFAANRIDRWRTARGIRAMLRDDEPHETAEAPSDYRTNAARLTPAETAPIGWLARKRAERAARYVQKLEDAATMKA